MVLAEPPILKLPSVSLTRTADLDGADVSAAPVAFSGEPDGDLLAEPAERALAASIAKAKFDTAAAINVESFTGAMNALAELRAPVDAFFEKVTVNVADQALRANRLKLLSEIRAATLNVADFSRISG